MATVLLIRTNPHERLGQVSALASLALRFFVFAMIIVVALIVAARARGGRHFETTTRLACAAIAGLATGLIAGGVMFALRNTPWGLHGDRGDAGVLADWASALNRGESIPPAYPPLSIHILARYADLLGIPPAHALKHLELLGTAAFGPIAYLSWRMLLRAPWALAIGVIATLPLVDPYKPYPNLVLVVFVPLAIRFLDTLREIADRDQRQVMRAGVGFGVAFGVLCLFYSGWYQWAAPGLFIATLVLLPWQTARGKSFILLGVAAVVFLLITGQYIHGLFFDPSGKIEDTYIYFDVTVEPMYVAMWKNDLPGATEVWPPVGELGGVGLFTIVLVIGMGLAIALGRKTTVVIALTSVMAGAWLMRFLNARLMWETKLVQLYPRTTPLILYCLLVLTGFAVYWLVDRIKEDHPVRGSSGVIAVASALLFLFCSTGTAISDRYMPSNTQPPGPGWLTYNAYVAKWSHGPKQHKSRPMLWVRRRL